MGSPMTEWDNSVQAGNARVTPLHETRPDDSGAGESRTMNIVRRTVLTVADNGMVSRFFRSNRLTRGLVSRFVAGESLEEAMLAAHDLDSRSITTTLDLLGENVDSAE